jgi:hypothetical protein
MDPVAGAIASSISWLGFTVLAGLYLAASKIWSFNRMEPLAAMHAHAHLGVVGIFLTLVVGVSYKLVPMFAISEIQSERRAWGSVALLNAGLLATATTILLGSAWKIVSAALLTIGILLYGWELAAILRQRKRRSIDFSLKTALGGIALLFPLIVLGVYLAWPEVAFSERVGRLENLYGFLALFGFLSMVVTGFLYKIVPFLIWYQVYSSKVGKFKVPALHEMFSDRLQRIGVALGLLGLVLTSAAILQSHNHCARIGLGLILGGFVLTSTNIALILSHLWRPRLAALAARPVKLNPISAHA